MAKNWTNLVKSHQARLDLMITPYDKTYGNDMWEDAAEPGASCPPMTTPEYSNELERNIS